MPLWLFIPVLLALAGLLAWSKLTQRRERQTKERALARAFEDKEPQ